MSKIKVHKLLRPARETWRAATEPWPRFERLARRHLTPCSLRLERLGSDYGGWYVPIDRLTPHSICYLAGVGEDITFDLALVARCGCQVHAFDPTPRAARHVAAAAGDVEAFHFYELGLWSADESKRFYAPRDPLHVSHSLLNLQRTDEFFEARCRPVVAIMRDLGHDHIDLLKLDIEGAEHEVIASMLADGIRPRIVAVEFDQPVPYRRMRRTFDTLLRADYALVCIDRLNLTFMRRAELDAEHS